MVILPECWLSSWGHWTQGTTIKGFSGSQKLLEFKWMMLLRNQTKSSPCQWEDSEMLCWLCENSRTMAFTLAFVNAWKYHLLRSCIWKACLLNQNTSRITANLIDFTCHLLLSVHTSVVERVHWEALWEQAEAFLTNGRSKRENPWWRIWRAKTMLIFQLIFSAISAVNC